MSEIIAARDLVKRFGTFTAVANVSFSVSAGQCFGFLGPNGAGKTTTIRMITCVSPVTAGSLTVAGMDVRTEPRQIKAALGVVPQDDNLDPDLTVRQNLRVYARYFDLPRDVADERIDESLALFQLVEKENQRIDSLSSGMRRRLTIAWQKLRLLRSQGVTMLLTTHYMDEAAHLCDRIVIMHQGQIRAEGTPDELVERFAGREVVEVHLGPQDRPDVLRNLAGRDGVTVEEVEDILYVFVRGSDGLDVSSLSLEADKVVLRRANLEDVFLRLTGRGLVE
jgi:lipooligosaccharide transport system ATP-binding protein